jgi:RNA polymerase sigma-70 factor, ECF subfamily
MSSNVENREEAELLAAAGSGDEAAFLALYQRHRRFIFHFVYRLLGTSAVAEEVTQECFMTMLAQAERYDPERAALRTYLCAIARNLAFKQLRKRGVEALADEPPDVDPPAATLQPLESLMEQELLGEVRKAVAALPPLQREALVLFEYEGMSLNQIADTVGTELGAVKARLHRARESLKRSLAPYVAGAKPNPRRRSDAS